MSRELPTIIQEVGFDFDWDVQKVWALDLPVEEMPIEEFAWHFDIPFIWSKPDGYYDVLPQTVMDDPGSNHEEYQRILDADTSYPIDIMYWKKRWLILDGLHRLMHLHLENTSIVKVRKVPQSAISLITK